MNWQRIRSRMAYFGLRWTKELLERERNTMSTMTRSEVADLMSETFDRLGALREAGQKEYAHTEDNAFGNFDRVAERLGLSREKVLMVYLMKHIDGITAYVNGHRSQRESVEGRLDDAHVYLELLRGMTRCRKESTHGEMGQPSSVQSKTRRSANEDNSSIQVDEGLQDVRIQKARSSLDIRSSRPENETISGNKGDSELSLGTDQRRSSQVRHFVLQLPHDKNLPEQGRQCCCQSQFDIQPEPGCLRLYCAGPMRGYPDFNFPAFDEATSKLRAQGHVVFNPAERDRAMGFTGDSQQLTKQFLADAMDWNCRAICRSDGIVLLPGWLESQGATIEYDLAKMIGKKVFHSVEDVPNQNAGVDLTSGPDTDQPVQDIGKQESTVGALAHLGRFIMGSRGG